MKIKLILYTISLLSSTFAVSGLDINHLFKTNHVWEARIFNLLLIFALAFLTEEFLYNLTTLI